MRKNRTVIANPAFPATFHITDRCVRQDFLLGDGKTARKTEKSRRYVILKRLKTLASAYAIDILRFALMDNHMHVELRNRPDLVQQMSDLEVARRTLIIFPGYCQANADAKRKRMPKPTAEDIQKLAEDKQRIREMRTNLSSVSSFMKSLKFYTSRYFNLVDGKRGAFWESRYNIKVLLDDLSILLCALYIDLNPIRAGMALTPETSIFTSAFYQILAARMLAKSPAVKRARLPDSFLPPVKISPHEADRLKSSLATRASDFGFTDMTSQEYLMLLDLMGRIVTKKHNGAIPNDLPPIFERMNLNWDNFVHLVNAYETLFCCYVGTKESLDNKARELNGRKIRCPAVDLGLLT